MSYLPFNSNPLIALYENSGQTYSGSSEVVLDLDTNLHQGSLSNNTFTLNFNCFLNADVKYNKTGTGYGTSLRIYTDGSQETGVGACTSGNASGYSSGGGWRDCCV